MRFKSFKSRHGKSFSCLKELNGLISLRKKLNFEWKIKNLRINHQIWFIQKFLINLGKHKLELKLELILIILKQKYC